MWASETTNNTMKINWAATTLKLKNVQFKTDKKKCLKLPFSQWKSSCLVYHEGLNTELFRQQIGLLSLLPNKLYIRIFN